MRTIHRFRRAYGIEGDADEGCRERREGRRRKGCGGRLRPQLPAPPQAGRSRGQRCRDGGEEAERCGGQAGDEGPGRGSGPRRRDPQQDRRRPPEDGRRGQGFRLDHQPGHRQCAEGSAPGGDRPPQDRPEGADQDAGRAPGVAQAAPRCGCPRQRDRHAGPLTGSMATTLPLAAGRIPPHDLDAEMSVIGSILLDPLSIAKVLQFLRPDDFYRENNGQIYRAALALFAGGEPIDNVTLAAQLQTMQLLDRVGGRAQLASMQGAVPTAANIEYYGRIVKEKAYKRRLISAGGNIAGYGYDDSIEAEDAINQAQSLVFGVADDRDQRELARLYDLLGPAMERISLQMESGQGIVGIPSGFHDLDRMTSGFKDSDLIIIAGRPAMGKTSLALNVGLHAALEAKRAIAIFSLEMSKEQLTERLLTEQAQIDAQRMHRGLLTEAEFDRVSNALGPLGE